jgi:Tfp pilus assembly protein PilN
MKAIATQLTEGYRLAEKAFCWWVDTITGMLPSRWQARLSKTTAQLRIEVRTDGIHITPTEKVGVGANGQTLASDSDLPDVLRSYAVPGACAIVVLAPELTLRHQVDLPLTAERHLGAILGHEVDRLTPLTSEQARHDVRVISRDRAAGRLSAELVVAERTLVERLEGAARAAQIQLTRITTTDDTSIDLRQRGRRVSRSARISALLALAAMGSLSAGLVLQLARYDAAVQAVQERVRQLRAEVRQVEALRKEVTALAARRALLDQERTRIPPLILLGEIARRLPDGTWLGAMSLTAKEIRLSGWSTDATGLPPLLEGSGFFQGVRFLAPVTHDATLKLDRFEITANWGALP